MSAMKVLAACLAAATPEMALAGRGGRVVVSDEEPIDSYNETIESAIYLPEEQAVGLRDWFVSNF